VVVELSRGGGELSRLDVRVSRESGGGGCRGFGFSFFLFFFFCLVVVGGGGGGDALGPGEDKMEDLRV